MPRASAPHLRRWGTGGGANLFTSWQKMLVWCRAFRKNRSRQKLKQALSTAAENGNACRLCSGCRAAVMRYGADYGYTGYCNECKRCPDCCECIFCGNCGSECAENQCGECARCDNCCQCRHCDQCDGTVVADEYCAQGGHCNECCECERCQGCQTRFPSTTAPPGVRTRCALHEDYCITCCACPRCTGCRHRPTDVRPFCDLTHEHRGMCTRCCGCSARKVAFFVSDLLFHPAQRHQRKVNPSARMISAEIELADIRRGSNVAAVVKKWSGSIVRDGSLPATGFEINTAPAAGDKYVEQVAEICKALNDYGAVITKECGLHVHVDARDLDLYAVRRLVKVYQRIESALFAMCSPSRWTSKYCMPCGDHYQGAMAKGVAPYRLVKRHIVEMLYKRSDDGIPKLRKTKYVGHSGDYKNGGRYYALNLHSYFYRGTIECRMFNGTASADKITHWGMLWARLIDYVAAHSDKEVERDLGTLNPYAALCRIVQLPVLIAFVAERIVKFRQEHRDAGMDTASIGAPAAF